MADVLWWMIALFGFSASALAGGFGFLAVAGGLYLFFSDGEGPNFMHGIIVVSALLVAAAVFAWGTRVLLASP